MSFGILIFPQVEELDFVGPWEMLTMWQQGAGGPKCLVVSLHAAGLLAGKRATTHWGSLERLRALGDVTVVEERYVRDGNVWSSAGVSAGIDVTRPGWALPPGRPGTIPTRRRSIVTRPLPPSAAAIRTCDRPNAWR